MDDATNNLTNEQIARMLGWGRGLGSTSADWPIERWRDSSGHERFALEDWTRSLEACLRDILPEIVRRGYRLELRFWEDVQKLCLYKPSSLLFIFTKSIDSTDPPSMARAICEALVRTEGRE